MNTSCSRRFGFSRSLSRRVLLESKISFAEIYPFSSDGVAVSRQSPYSDTEILFLPLCADPQQRAQGFNILVPCGEQREEFVADLVEERTDYHVHLLHPRFLRSAHQKADDDEGDEENRDRKERETRQAPEEDVTCILEEGVVNHVQNKRTATSQNAAIHRHLAAFIRITHEPLLCRNPILGAHCRRVKPIGLDGRAILLSGEPAGR